MEQHQLNVHLLGGFRITLSGQILTCFNQSRQQSLLAYLMLHADTPQSRQHVAFCFWPDSSEERAYANLRYTLHQLRHSCPELELFLESTQLTLQWRALASFRLDVAEYETLIQQANETADSAQVCKLLIHAANLYQGDLLPGCYDDWIIPVRERLSQTHAQLLRQLVDRLAAEGEYQAAIDYATRLRSYDPFREMSYRRLMELYEATGDRAAALRVYHDCVSVLARELGVEPGPETRAVYERIVNPTALPVTPIQPSPPVIAAAPGDRLIGRWQEWQQLQSAWQTAREGRPHLVLIRGEGGIGKTRLAEELATWANQRGHLTVRTRAYAAEGQLAYAPVVGWLRAELYRDKLRTLDSVWLVELARLLPELLGEIPDLPHLTPLTDRWQRQRLFEALAHAALSVGLPLLVLMDDLQWADQETLEWLHFLFRFHPPDGRPVALLVVGTARMEEVDAAHPLSALLMHLRHDVQVSEIELDALDAAASAELAQQAAGRPLEPETLAALYTYAEGVPLFLVEAVRAGADNSGEDTWRWHNVGAADSTPSPAPASIPPRVYAVLQARLAQLSPEARRLADLAAVIGRSFAVDLLAQASGAGEAELVRGLDELWKRRLVRERGADYDISHDRIRDVAYAEIAPMQRRMLHRKVGQALEHIDAADLDAVSAQLAWHYEQGALPKQAVEYYRRAGMAAQRVYANNQAIDLFRKGLALLAELPASAERDRQELSLQMAMAASARTKSFLASEVNQAFNRALELSRKVDGAKQHFWPLWGLHVYHLIRGEMRQCQEVTQSLLTIAQQEQTPQFLLVAHTSFGGTSFLAGELLVAMTHFAQCANLYTPEMHEEQVLITGVDYGLLLPAWNAHALWCLGHADQALRKCQTAFALARHLADPFSQVRALAYFSMLHQFRRDNDAAQAQAEAALALAIRHEVSYYGAWAAILAQWALAWAHPGSKEIAGLRKALHDFRATGAGLRWPYYLSLLAEVYAKAGQPDAGLETIGEALAVAAEKGEQWWNAELHRLRGELLLAQGADVQQVGAAFQRALAIARQQQVRALELRAATSLARLWRQSQTDQACRMLSAVYCQFDEGFDTLDLQEAKALLAELA
jgi:DNA-binding SARP family transcriptional activator/predicted ATPase